MTTNTDRARLEYEAVAQLDYAMAEAAAAFRRVGMCVRALGVIAQPNKD